ncbi:MbcA/ParS/Xre antitoxin family protein [Pelobacter seleniigenes]|uniref:MbcA/ParS/Xre antitoxin family protein n=1 Tax=Pelobacter seleniigenes TaxID=407188 RepID=UPI000A051BFD|nr:MbcA/ParS/Xre antitoxin family protein [Pelobacter seleniigenes]
MNENVPKDIALTTLQNLPSSSSWPRILDEMSRAWASTCPAAVLERTTEVFEEKTKVIGWLTTPCSALGNRIPLVMVDSEKGQQAILDELSRIEHGVFS